MIQIQIAGGLSEQGVSDICWVLLDPADPVAPPLVGAWWLASAKLQSTAPPLAQWAVPSSKPPLSAPVSRP